MTLANIAKLETLIATTAVVTRRDLHQVVALCRDLELENSALKKEQVAYDKEIDRLQASNSALRSDAERYRFIRGFDGWGIFDHKRGAELDAAIDAARKEMQARATETNVERRGGCTLTDCRDALDE